MEVRIEKVSFSLTTSAELGHYYVTMKALVGSLKILILLVKNNLLHFNNEDNHIILAFNFFLIFSLKNSNYKVNKTFLLV
jgi:superfamily I DNA and RNA helicase